MKGKELLNLVADATGLPQALVVEELQCLAREAGLSIEQLTLDDLRDLLAEYLQDVLLLAQKVYTPKNTKNWLT